MWLFHFVRIIYYSVGNRQQIVELKKGKLLKKKIRNRIYNYTEIYLRIKQNILSPNL